MKSLLCVAALMLATVDPAAAAGASCWTSADGNHLIFPPGHTSVSYAHDRGIEPCDVMNAGARHYLRVWCDQSSRAGIAVFLSARRGHPREAVLWDSQVFYRESCWS